VTRPKAIEIPTINGACRRRDRVFARAPGAGIAVRSAGAITEIEIVGEIGADVTLPAFREKLRAAGEVKLTINSPGGDAFTGLAIFNSAVAHPAPVNVEIIGVAASAASIIAMAGDTIHIAQNAHLMVHRSWGLTVGNTQDHAAQAAVLERIDQSMAVTYADRTGRTVADMLAAMTAETWINADEAVEMGFADEVINASAASARFDLSVFANVPDSLRGGSPSRPDTSFESPSDLEQFLHAAGLPRKAAKRVTAGGFGALSKSENQTEALEMHAFAAGVAEMNAVLKQLRVRG
jgi:ATP-dependent Clp protease protease subunit